MEPPAVTGTRELSLIQIKSDNGPESNGRRTQFLKRMVEVAGHTGKPVQILYYPPYHSKYNPVERCWGILEKHWNGAKLVDVNAMLGWAKSQGHRIKTRLLSRTYRGAW